MTVYKLSLGKEQMDARGWTSDGVIGELWSLRSVAEVRIDEKSGAVIAETHDIDDSRARSLYGVLTIGYRGFIFEPPVFAVPDLGSK